VAIELFTNTITPQVKQKKRYSLQLIESFFAKRVAVLRSRTVTSGRERSVACEVECSTESVKRQGKNISQPLGVH
jgi:hypothetical protein